jgi:hypothetical protein
MLGKHPIRNLLVFWMGRRLWRRHEMKEARKKAQRASRPYPTSSRMRK